MASMNKDKPLGEQKSLEEKPKIGDFQEPSENSDEINEANLANSAATMDKELETSTTTVDLHRPRHRKLPAELNQQIFLCFNPATQCKFICGLGWDFYAMFRHRLLTKTKRVRNPHGNRWDRTNTTVTIAADGLNVSNKVGYRANIFAEQPFPTSGPHCRVDEFPGTILYYYEVRGHLCTIGLSDGAIPADNNLWIGEYPNSFAIPTRHVFYECWLAGEQHPFELPEGAIQPEQKDYRRDIYGCGLVLDPQDTLWIFFALNGQLFGQKIQFHPTVDHLFPSVTMMLGVSFFEANFGDDPAKPFEYDIKNCPGLKLAGI